MCFDGSAINACANDFGGPVTIRDADGITTQIGIASFISPVGCTAGIPGGLFVKFYQ
jgi:secreted trypsin-like serine protease